EASRGRWLGEGPARAWLQRRYAVSYRQSPLFAGGVFVDTLEVAARWSSLEEMYDRVREALGGSALVTAHFSHAYPDGCCVYFTFLGSADRRVAGELGWDAACEVTYDRAWRRALEAASGVDGGTIAHHHGVGRSKSGALARELGAGVAVVRALMRAFDPDGILNPGNLVPDRTPAPPAPPLRPATGTEPPVAIDSTSLLARAAAPVALESLEDRLRAEGLTLDASFPPGARFGEWLSAGAPGARDRWLDPADQLVAGFDGVLHPGPPLSLRPVPRRAIGPDLTALFVGAADRYGTLDRAWLRVHRRGAPRPTSAPFAWPRDPAPNAGEDGLLDAIAASLGRRP
ncbi:MAG: FAD-binding oxidoreductase, partial [Myxococcales bacterium]|nr:FAD-binding oxidoreductase [Myxococcales bacterium]